MGKGAIGQNSRQQLAKEVHFGLYSVRLPTGERRDGGRGGKKKLRHSTRATLKGRKDISGNQLGDTASAGKITLRITCRQKKRSRVWQRLGEGASRIWLQKRNNWVSRGKGYIVNWGNKKWEREVA